MSKADRSHSAPWFLFDSGDGPDADSALLFEDPVETIRADEIEQITPALEQLQQAIDRGLYAAGFFSYEMGYALEPSLRPLIPPDRQVPLIWFACFPKMRRLRATRLQEFFAQHASKSGPSKLNNITPAMSKQDYLHRFAQVKELIAAGDIYQVNLTLKMDFQYQGSPFAIYADLRQRQPVSYGAFLQGDDFSILSHSPELFFEIENGDITSRPMKGTIRRGTTPDEDRQLLRELNGDVKNRAENLMIVDLMRNDLSRICEIGSVNVSDLYDVKPFPTLYQMTSDVSGRLREDVQLTQIIKALMPAGSITGAPKIRAQEVIHELEEQPRGVYCGAIGALSRDQKSRQLSARFNVAIRTLTLFPDGQGEAGIGSGVVQDSEGEAEYEECLLKAKFMSGAGPGFDDLKLADFKRPDFKLIETMRLDPDGSYFLKERHLSRLQCSCTKLEFSCPLEEIDEALYELSKSLKKSTYLVRLLLSKDGEFTLSSTKIDPPDPDKIISFIISNKRVESGDTLLAHKTTRREMFDEEWSRANEQRGADEVLFLNERSELTEGSRSTLFVKQGGKYLTPPLSCGLLPGTLREQLMADGQVVETILILDDLDRANIYFGNSVRGLQPARLLESE